MRPIWQLSVSQQYHYFVTGDTTLLLDLIKFSRFIAHIVHGIGSECRTTVVQVEFDVREKLSRFALRYL